MPIIDPGITVVDDLGRPLFSPRAQKLAAGNSNIPPPDDYSPNISKMPSAVPGIENLPLPIAPAVSGHTGDDYASNTYKNTLTEQPNRDDPRFQHHGLAKLGDVITSLAGGPFAPLVYSALKQAPYHKAENDWKNKLAAIKPALSTEEAQNREAGENTRAAANLASVDADRKAREVNESRLRDIEQQRADNEQRKLSEIVLKNKNNLELAKERLALIKTLHPDKKLGHDDVYIQLTAKKMGGEQLTPEETNELAAIENFYNETKIKPGVARVNAAEGLRPVQVADPTTGNTNWDTAANAIKNHANTSSSVPFQVLRANALVGVPTTVSRTMAQMAKTIEPQMKAISDEVDQLANSLGPAIGRWNDLWVNKAGLDDPKFAHLDQNLDLLASSIVRTHFGAHGGMQYQKTLKKNFSEAQSPEDLKARIAAADGWIIEYKNMTDSKSDPKVKDPKKPDVKINHRRPV